MTQSNTTFIKLAGIGSYLPNDPVPFERINDVLGVLDNAPPKIQKWIEKTSLLMKEMLGIDYYYYAMDPVTREFTDDNISMAYKASMKALDNAHLLPSDIDCIVYGAPYMFEMPSPSAKLQEKLGIESCAELSIHANCTSVYKAILVASDMIRCGRYRTVLVATSNMSSSTLRAEYYNQAVVKKEDLFLRWYLCDGAGALVLRAVDTKENGFYITSNYMESVGGKKPSAMYMRYPSMYVSPREIFEKGDHHLAQAFQDELSKNFHEEGGTVFHKGLQRMIAEQAIDISRIAALQINMPTKHVVDLIADECAASGIARDKLYTAIDKCGYAGPPAAVISLDRLLKEKTFTGGDSILSFVAEVSKFLLAGFTIEYFSK
jgi:3-oxoacyl-[acyl-carrier-protein] synthase III